MLIRNNWIKVGALVSALGVAIGGFDYQQISSLIGTTFDGTEQFTKAVQFQLVHGLAIVLTGIVLVLRPGRLLQVTAWLFLAGTILFSGSIYLRLVTEMFWLEQVKLIGVVALAAGWIMLVEGACPGWNRTESDTEKESPSNPTAKVQV